MSSVEKEGPLTRRIKHSERWPTIRTLSRVTTPAEGEATWSCRLHLSSPSSSLLRGQAGTSVNSQLSGEKNALICSICQFAWCETSTMADFNTWLAKVRKG